MTTHFSPLLLLAAQPQVAPPTILDADSETYQSLLSCAAFHAIEADRVARDANAAAAQKAISRDFLDSATPFGPNHTAEAAEQELIAMVVVYRERLENGEPRAMAEQWTALELACRDLYPARTGLVRDRKTSDGER